MSILILSTNYALDKILNEIDGQVRQNIEDSMKNFVSSLLKVQNFNSTKIMAEIDNKIAIMYMNQRFYVKDPYNFVSLLKFKQ